MSNLPSPFVYWAQSETQVTLKVDLKDVKVSIQHSGRIKTWQYVNFNVNFIQKDPDIQLRDKSITFNGYGVAACGSNQYSFHIDLYSQVDTEVRSSNY